MRERRPREEMGKAQVSSRERRTWRKRNGAKERLDNTKRKAKCEHGDVDGRAHTPKSAKKQNRRREVRSH